MSMERMMKQKKDGDVWILNAETFHQKFSFPLNLRPILKRAARTQKKLKLEIAQQRYFNILSIEKL